MLSRGRAWVAPILEEKFDCFTDVKALEELNLPSLVKTLLIASNRLSKPVKLV